MMLWKHYKDGYRHPSIPSSQQHYAFGMDNHCFSMHLTWQDLEEIGEACLLALPITTIF
jgi:hypothetical protein